MTPLDPSRLSRVVDVALDDARIHLPPRARQRFLDPLLELLDEEER
jgi:hypothetical protein